MKDYTSDGVHLKAKYITLWEEYLKDNAVLIVLNRNLFLLIRYFHNLRIDNLVNRHAGAYGEVIARLQELQPDAIIYIVPGPSPWAPGSGTPV
mgnify:CR=1 FL=1